MAIATTDHKAYLTGGSANTNVNLSLGGAISATLITDNVINNLFDNVSTAESLAGMTDYRCIAIKNENSVSAGSFTVNNMYAIITLGTTDFTLIGATSVTASAFVIGTTYTITAIGTTDFTLIGAAANTVGTRFTATGAGTGTGTAVTTVFTATGVGTGTGTAGQIAQNVSVYISANTPSPGTDVSIGLDPNGVSVDAVTTTPETTAPTGVTFSQPTTAGVLTVGSILPQDYVNIWLRWVVTAGAAAYTNDSVSLSVDLASEA